MLGKVEIILLENCEH